MESNIDKHSTIAVTGASGHLAASLIPLLVENGHAVRALQFEQALPYSDTGIQIVKGSLTDLSALDALVADSEVVIHCASKISIHSNQDESIEETNVAGTKNLFNAAKRAKVKRFIYVGSIHAYHQWPTDQELNENQAYCDHRAARYDRTKRDAQQWVLAQASEEMEVLSINPTAIIGPSDYRPSLMGQAILSIYHRSVPALVRGGFDFCDARDVSEAIVRSIHQGSNGHVYLLSGQWHNLAEVQQILLELKGGHRRLPVLPGWMAYLGLPFIQLLALIQNKAPLYTKESLHTLLHGNKKISSLKAEQELGYQCRPLKETLTDTLHWYRQAGYLQK